MKESDAQTGQSETTDVNHLLGLKPPPPGHCTLCGLKASEDHRDPRMCAVLLRERLFICEMELDIADGTIVWLRKGQVSA